MKYIKLYEQFRLLLEADEKKDNTILYNLSQGGEKTLILLPGSGKDGGQGKDDFQLLADTLGVKKKPQDLLQAISLIHF